MSSTSTADGPARFCYVVMCHTDADGALRLARRVRETSPRAAVLLRYSQHDYVTAEQARAVGAHLLHSPITVGWGGWSLVEATMEALAVAERTLGADHYVVLSGQDHPVRDLASWESEVVRSGADAVIAPMGTPHPDTYRYSWREPRPAPRWVPATVDRVAARLATTVGPALSPLVACYRNGRDLRWAYGVRRTAEPPVPLVKGATWLTLSARAVSRVLARHDGDAAVHRYFTAVRCPDELYLPSLLHSEAGLVLREGLTSYARFEEGAASPVWLGPDELVAAAASGAAFARKVGPGRDDVRDLADQLSGAATTARATAR